MNYNHPGDIEPAGLSVEQNGNGASQSLALPKVFEPAVIPKRVMISVEGSGDTKFNLAIGASAVTEANGCHVRGETPICVRTLGRTHINHFTTTGSTIHVTPLND